VNQRQQQQQLQQITPIEAQLALRQHIWSSLLANLRFNPRHDQQSGENLRASKTGTGQLHLDYGSANTISQQQQANSLLAPPAATSVSAPRNHSTPMQQQQHQQQANAIGLNDLTSLATLATPENANTLSNLIPMRMYTTPGLTDANMAPVFNGNTDTSCK